MTELVLMVAFDATVPVGAFQAFAEKLRTFEGIKAVVVAEVPSEAIHHAKITVVGADD